jgi:coenzyme F420 hydrogenase subunit beta
MLNAFMAMADPKRLSIAFTDHALCTRCGTCAGVCPTSAIDFDAELFPSLVEDRCIDCGLCAATCPGGRVPFGDLTEATFGHRTPPPGFDGHVAKSCVGYATDETLRAGGAGGGVVTALLWDQLRSGKVDGCIVTRMIPDTPWRAEPFIARTLEELQRSQGSRYMIIPVNRIVALLQDLPGRYAFAGLPCQVHGLRMMMRERGALADKLYSLTGLFCGGSLEPCVVDEMLQTRGLDQESLADFQFRGGEWPGRMRAVLKDGSVHNLHYSNYKDGAYNYFISLYMPRRCQTCIDGSNEFADVAVSDAWTRDATGEYTFKAHSRILVRTPRGEDIVQGAAANGTLAVRDVGSDPHYRTHRMQTKRKGLNAPLRIQRQQRKGRRVPIYDRPCPASSRRERMNERIASSLLWIGRHRSLRYPLMKFLTSSAAIPLIRLRILLKKRKYRKGRNTR